MTILWYVIPCEENGMVFFIKSMILFMLWLGYAVGVDSNFLSNKVMRFFSDISMEMYLAQMVIFRMVEKLHVLYLFGDSGVGGWISYLLTFVLTVIGLVVLILGYKWVLAKIKLIA